MVDLVEVQPHRLPIMLALALAALLPASAQAQKPADVTRIESAVVDLAKQKRGSERQVASHRREAESAIGACRTAGPGWARIRGVRDRSQREAYARGAKTLWSNLREVASEGAWVGVYKPHFERFLRRFETPLSDPLLQAGIGAQRKRVAYNEAAYSFGTCSTFNTQLKKVREFKIGGSHGVSGDYYAGRSTTASSATWRAASAPPRAHTGAAATRRARRRAQPAQGAGRRRGLRELLRLRLQGLSETSRPVA